MFIRFVMRRDGNPGRALTGLVTEARYLAWVPIQV